MIAAVVIACLIMYASSAGRAIRRGASDYQNAALRSAADRRRAGGTAFSSYSRGYIYFAIVFSRRWNSSMCWPNATARSPLTNWRSRRRVVELTRRPDGFRSISRNCEGDDDMTKAVRVHKVGVPKPWYMRTSTCRRRQPARCASASMPSD